ncbi:hypothetical protein EHQ96_03800 [Leptospira levettii]|uniref:Redoxin n=2 Tax=Leptospira levettii TaxID=2023178 RepID=A0ABY2MP40_9LEPT|nr:hypothetical protein CH354_16730 [Leptospira levettii]PKA22931.1 hypothetical protein CH381_28400 [Leptospira sp. mixed culture ATI2-C-A1]PJZ89938.1 hypothetical protein CH368_04055 [Leptospira levettii]PJZ99715.1 hypothetical protein CH369_13100 [Leptospira levettii]TGK99730.1 hypothetical protein EHQ34_16185 [Leptospira levettii]
MGFMKTPLSLLISLCLITCAPAKSSYFGETLFVGVTADGEEINFANLAKDQIAMNVYSPDCVPCWKEIPALNLLYAEIQNKFPNKAIYMVVDPYQIVPDVTDELPFGQVYQMAKERMKVEIKNRNIQIPIIFMKKPFRVKEGGLVTGTPETLLFETKPLRLYYNFLGSISELTTKETIEKDPKFNFFRYQFGMESI